MSLSRKDTQKPFILIAAMAVGVAIQMFIGQAVAGLMIVTQLGIFATLTAIMVPIEVSDLGAASRKLKPTAIALFVNFIIIPAFAWSLGWLVLRNYPDLWVGAVLYTLTPCIGWYLIFTDIAQGNTAWGVALLPWNVTFQMLLLPVYLYLLVGRVIPVGMGVLFESIGLYLIAPAVLSIVIRRAIIAARGRAYFDGRFKAGLGKFKLWALVAVIISMFVSQNPLSLSDLKATGLLIALLVAFFAALFALALLTGRVFRLTYEDNATLAFTTTARNSEVVIGVALAAFPGHPLVYMAIILGPIVELPVLLLIAQVLLSWRAWIGVPAAAGRSLEKQLAGSGM